MVKFILSLTAAETVLRLLKLLFFLYIANIFGAENLGRYSYFTSVFAIIFVLSDFGITKNITLQLLKKRDVLSSAWLRIALFILFSLFFITESLAFFVFMLFLGDVLFELVYAVLRAKEKFFKESFIKLLISFIYLGVIAISYLFHLGLEEIFFLLSFSLFSLSLYHFLKHYKTIPGIKDIKVNWYIYIALLMTIVYFKADIIIIKHFFDYKTTGIYSSSMKIIEIATVITSIAGTVMLPKLVKRKAYFKENLLLALFLTLLFFFLSPFILKLLFPKFYIQGAHLVQILSLALFPIVLNNYFFTLFLAKNKELFYAAVTSFMALSNLFGNIVAAKYGVEYIAAVSVATEMIGAAAAFYLYLSKGKRW